MEQSGIVSEVEGKQRLVAHIEHIFVELTSACSIYGLVECAGGHLKIFFFCMSMLTAVWVTED